MSGNRPSVPTKRFTWYLRRDLFLYLLLLLPIVYFLLFKYAPMYGVTVAFKDYNIFKGVFGSEWIGLDAFREIFGMKETEYPNSLAVSLARSL